MPVHPIPAGDVTVSVDGRVVTIAMNRPAKLNALTQAMYRDMTDSLLAADADLGVSAVIVTGGEKAFTAGNDLGDFAAGASLHQVVRFLDAIATIRVPVVAAVSGPAVGVGLTMLAHFDLVYVEPSARLSVPFVPLGLVPEAASSLLLPRLVGPRRATELLLGGRAIDGTEAAEWGLATAAVSPALDAARDAALRLAELPPQAVRATKALMHSEEATVAGRMAEEMAEFRRALGGPEFAQAVEQRARGRAAS